MSALLTLLATLPTLAATPPETDLLFEQSPVATGTQPCNRPSDESTSVEYTFSVAEESWLEFDGLGLGYRAEFTWKACDVILDELDVQLDGSRLHTEDLDFSSFTDGTALGIHTGSVLLVSQAPMGDQVQIERIKLSAGTHTLTFSLSGNLDGQSSRIRITAAGPIRYGRDWDLDGHDDDALRGGEDCDDDNATINPTAMELWYDGVDQDCAGDDDFDQDGDTFQAEGEIEGGDDCDDTRADTYPGAEEVWYDGIDQNCDGDSDFDQDGDGFDSPDHGGDDCDDEDGTSYPGSRTRDEDCGFVVRDNNNTRDLPGTDEATGYGCTRGLPAMAGLALLPLAGFLRRRTSHRRS